MILVYFAEGFEELEALAPVDVLRRGGFKVLTVGVGTKKIKGAHGVEIICDMVDTEVADYQPQAVILPGGMPGTLNLKSSKEVCDMVKSTYNRGDIVAAICAAPSVLGALGILNQKKATCFPGFEHELIGAHLSDEHVCVDQNVVTAKGAGVALEFAFVLLDILFGDSTAGKKMGDSMQCVR